MAEYIEREYAVDAVVDVYYNTPDINLSCEKFETAIFKIPAADVAPVRHGRWIEDHDYLKCTECSVMVKRDFTFFDIGDWNYCPNCGARMTEDIDEQKK